MALIDSTRTEIRQAAGDRLGDFTALIATGNGSTTTFVDAMNINAGAESYDGQDIYFTSGANAGLTSRVQTTTAGSNLLTFTPARTSTVAADTAECYNKRGRGFKVAEYHRAINMIIEELNGMTLIPTIETIASAYSATTQTITVPETTLEVSRVEFEDGDDLWQEIPKAKRKGQFGWTAEPSAGVIRVEGAMAWAADGLTVRLHGKKRQAALTTDAGTCAFDLYTVKSGVAYSLAIMGLDRDPRYAQLAGILRDEWERAKPRAVSIPDPGAVRVRL